MESSISMDHMLILGVALQVPIILTILMPIDWPCKQLLLYSLSRQQVSAPLNTLFTTMKVAFAALFFCNVMMWIFILKESDGIRVLFSFALLLVATLLHKLQSLIDGDASRIVQAEKEAQQRAIIGRSSPSALLTGILLGVWNWLFDPQLLDVENIPKDKPILLIGNHAILALEAPFLFQHLKRREHIFVRALADYFHFYIPLWRNVLSYAGAFNGTRQNCAEVMKAKQTVLIYPGGGREVLKIPSDGPYELMWKNRVGFARLAIEHQYTIIPVATVGTPEMFKVLFAIPLGKIFACFGRSESLPIVLPPSLGNIQRIYFKFGKPISTERYNKDISQANCEDLRDLAKSGLLSALQEAQSVQKTDPKRYWRSRWNCLPTIWSGGKSPNEKKES